MAITNTSKPTTSLTDITKVMGTTWATILTTWATETGTWLSVSQSVVNTSKPVTAFTNVNKPS